MADAYQERYKPEPAGGGLFALHLMGPDDVYAAPSYEAALRVANAINLQFADNAIKPYAVVVPWHGTPEQHAGGLVDWERDFRASLDAIATTPPPDAAVGAQGEESLRVAVDRFLAWPLPADFAPDAGVTFTPPGHPNGWPSGTNLFTAVQAKAMFEHCLSAAPAAGKGVDDAMESLDELAEHVGRLNPECCNASFPVAAARRCIATVRAALTRQPVAGDGWQPIEGAPRETLLLLANARTGAVGSGHMDARGAWWWQHHPTHWMPLPFAPTDTPADGGEGSR